MDCMKFPLAIRLYQQYDYASMVILEMEVTYAASRFKIPVQTALSGVFP